MATPAVVSATDVHAFINEYFDAWQVTDEEPILSYYSDDVSLQIPGTTMKGKAAVRDQFVRPFINGFPAENSISPRT